MRRFFLAAPPQWREKQTAKRPRKKISRGVDVRCPVFRPLVLICCLLCIYALSRLWRPTPKPLLIPRVIAQSWKDRNLSAKYVRLTDTWKDQNPGWNYTFFDDNDCLAYVTRRFPQYLDAYIALKKPVERSDLFRYLWLLGDGGMWADLDTEALAPLDSVLGSNDTLVVSVEAEKMSFETATLGRYGRWPTQICQWAMAAAPGHAALQAVVDAVVRVALNGTVLSSSPDFDVILRTGPAPWTDAVLPEAAAGRARVLPQVVFAGRKPAPGAVCIHHFRGIWRTWT